MVFKFGKYKGYALADVERMDPGYIRWAKQNAPNLIPKPAPRQKLVFEEEDEYIQQYKDLPLIDPKDAF